MENFATYRLTQTGPETQAILDQVNENTTDIAQLRALYEALTQSEPVIIQPSDTWPVADPEENVIYRVIDRVNTPPESYSDYMWNGTAMVLMATYDNAIDSTPTAGSNNPVASGGVLDYVSTNGSAYDISAANSGTAYEDLSAALGTDGANVPAAVRKGGMSVKFVQTSDNKYIQARCMAQNFTTDVTQWQGVDDEPTAGSNNLVKSGGIAKMDTVGVKRVVEVESNTSIIIPYPFKAGKKYVLAYTGKISTAYTSNSSSWGQERIEEVTGIEGTNKSTVFIPVADADYMTFWRTTDGNGTFTISVPTTETERIENYINNICGLNLLFWWSNGSRPEFVESLVSGTDSTNLEITMPNSWIRVIDLYSGKKLYQGNLETRTFTLSDVQSSALKYNVDTHEFSVVSIAADTPDTLDPRKDFIALYKLRSCYGGPIAQYIEDFKSTKTDAQLSANMDSMLSRDFDITFLDNWSDFDVHCYPFRKGEIYILTFSEGQSSFWTLTKNWHDTSARIDNLTNIDANTPVVFRPTDDADYCEAYRAGTLKITHWYKNYVNKSNILTDIEFDYIGNGLFMSCSDIERQLIKGHTYSVVPTKTTWNVPENTASYNYNAFGFSYKDGDNRTKYLLRSKYPPGSSVMNEPLPALSYITIPDEAVSIAFGFRATIGESVGFIVKDITSIVEYVDSQKENPQEITTMYLEKEYLPKVATLKKLVPYNWGAANTRNIPLVLLMFTDIHGDINNLKRIITWKNKYANYIDDVINAGDTVTDSVTNYDSVMPSYFAEGGDKVLMALGNHDVCAGGSYKGWSANSNLTIQDVYNKYTALLNASLNIIKPTTTEIGDVANYANFYYKDYTSGVVSNKPVRLIVLDSCITEASIIQSGTGNDTTATIAYQNAQLTWFVSKLNEAKTLGYAVVVMCHSTPEATEKVSPSAFTVYPTSLSISTDNSSSIPMTFVEAVDDFISANGEFVCWLVGHTHANHIATVTGHDNQLVVGFNTATSRSYAASPTNPYRTGYNGAAPITETTDAFCMVQIDTYYKVVRLVNVGTDYDMYGRKKDMIAINYISREILL